MDTHPIYVQPRGGTIENRKHKWWFVGCGFVVWFVVCGFGLAFGYGISFFGRVYLRLRWKESSQEGKVRWFKGGEDFVG